MWLPYKKTVFLLADYTFSFGDFSTTIMLIMLNLFCSCGSTYIFTSFSIFYLLDYLLAIPHVLQRNRERLYFYVTSLPYLHCDGTSPF